MHALFVTPAFPPFPGGGERFVRSLALNLAGRGIQVTVLTSNASKESDLWHPAQSSSQSIQINNDGPLRIISCATSPMPGGFRGLIAWRKFMVLISALPGDQTPILSRMARRIPNISNINQALNQVEESVDLVHCFNLSWENSTIAGWRYAQRQNIPFIITPFLHSGVKSNDRVFRNSAMDHQVNLLKQASIIHTLTNIEKIALVGLGCSPDRITSVGSGTDLLPSLSEETLKWVESQSQDPYILFIGRNSYDKGCIHAVKAMLAPESQIKNLNLVIIGQSTDELSRFLKKAKVHKNASLKILGVVSEEKKHALLERSLLLLLPSRTDSFGIVILEAWAHGKPVIGARAGGLSEVISEGEDGFLINFGDVHSLNQRIRTLVDNPALRGRLAKKGQRKLKDIYNWQTVGDLVNSSYQQVLS